MVTGELKGKIDSLWEIFWTGGLTNPLDVIEQMTYLMFIHDLDDSDNLRAKEAAMLGLPYWRPRRRSSYCSRNSNRDQRDT
jgi:type I restriction enzyme M protein